MRRRAETDHSGPYQLFMLLLCAYVLTALGVRTVASLDSETLIILDVADFGICLIFFADFLWSLFRAREKWDYIFRWGWIDLVSSIPMIGVLRWGRMARIIRIFRGFRASEMILKVSVQRRAESVFFATVLASLLLVVFCSIAILQFEPGAEGANIHDAHDALWWVFVTITTVGYGDYVPVTTEGRVLAALLMASGVGLLGTFTGFFASWLVSTGEAEVTEQKELQDLIHEVAELKRIILAKGKSFPRRAPRSD